MVREISKLWPVPIIALVALALGRVIISGDTAVSYARHGDYWLFLGLTIWGGILLFRSIDLMALRAAIRRKQVLFAMLGIVAAWGLTQIHERDEYKILIDEPTQVGASMMLHLHREAATPLRVHRLNGGPEITNSYVDKRPQLYPFFVSLVHDVTGYRIANAFWTNALLSLILIAMLFVAGHRLGGYLGGYIVILLWAGVPEFARTANGAGFETLNLVMILGILLLGWRHLRLRTPRTQDLLCLAGVMAAYVRYESVLFVFAVGAFLGLVWLRERRVFLSPVLLAAPLLLVPYLWRNQVFSESEHLWQMWDQEGVTSPFALGYGYDNIGHALNYFFSLNDQLANSFWVAAIGFAAVIACLPIALRLRRERAWDFELDGGFFVFLLALAAHLMLMLTYFYGQFDNFIISRLALPYYLVFALAPIYACSRLKAPPVVWRGLLAASALVLMFYGQPKISRHLYSERYHPANEWWFGQRFLEKTDHPHVLVISRMPALWATMGVDATSIVRVNNNLDHLKWYLAQENNPPVYLFELIQYDGSRDVWGPANAVGYPIQALLIDERVETELVMREMVTPLMGQRMSRVVGVKDVEPPVFEGETNDEYLRFRAENLP